MEWINYSQWERSAKDVKEIGQENFIALFDSRSSEKLDKAMEEFLKAYAKAVKETKIENRFPKLREIQEKMDSGDVYSLKKRLIDNTAFFDEVSAGASGVFLVPKAKEFADSSGRYSNLVFDFDGGKIILPRLIKEEAILIEEWRKFKSEWKDLETMTWRNVSSLVKPWLYALLLILALVVLILTISLVWMLSKI